MPNRLLGIAAVVLLLILPNLVDVVRVFADPAHVAPRFAPGRYYRDIGQAFLSGDAWEVLKVNLWLGHKAKWWWTIENGRYLQMLGLFSLGLLLGRLRLFEQPEKAARVAWRVLLVSLVLLVPLYLLKNGVSSLVPDRNEQRLVTSFVGMQVNLVQMLGGSALLVLLFRTGPGRRVVGLLIPYGRMSLSCYVSQAVVAVPLFYNFGLGLYRHMGAFYSLSAGVVFFVCHLALAHLWLRHFHQGPLEWLWRCATERDFSRPFRRRPACASAVRVGELAGVA